MRGWLPWFREWDGAFLCSQVSQPEVFLDVVERLTVIIAANVSQKVPERSWFPLKFELLFRMERLRCWPFPFLGHSHENGHPRGDTAQELLSRLLWWVEAARVYLLLPGDPAKNREIAVALAAVWSSSKC